MRSLLPFLIIALSVGLFYIFINPQYKEIKNIQGQREQYKNAIDKVESLKKVRDDLLSKYNTLPKENLIKLEKMIPSNLNTVKLISDIASVGGPYGIAIRGVSTRDIADAGEDIAALSQKPYETTSISFKFSATYQNMVSFLRDIERSLQLVDVKTLQFTAKDDITGINEYDITIQTYWIK
ncbi:MAG TPA: type 4a pilus biogenesis protein PilO [Candidatus Paceibacterota bacterium]